MAPPVKHVIRNGDRFGRLIVIRKAGTVRYRSGGTHRRYRCECDCGRQVTVYVHQLCSGKTRSCGCLQRELAVERSTAHGPITHGHASRSSVSPTYQSWASMIRRCTYPGVARYERYGGRGITVCDRWRQSFEAFLADMGERPAGMTLDRIDNDGHYEPGNVRWASPSEQALKRPRRMLVARDNRKKRHG